MRAFLPILPALFISGAMLLSPAAILADEPPTTLTNEQRAQLERNLEHSRQGRGSWISIHAAEALITLGQSESVIKTFQPQSDTAIPPYRIGVWRVLARA